MASGFLLLDDTLNIPLVLKLFIAVLNSDTPSFSCHLVRYSPSTFVASISALFLTLFFKSSKSSVPASFLIPFSSKESVYLATFVVSSESNFKPSPLTKTFAVLSLLSL